MRTKYQLSPADEKCRIVGALGTHCIAVGAVMSQVSQIPAIGFAICGIGIIATIGAFVDLFKR
jgi:hypothetical protein